MTAGPLSDSATTTVAAEIAATAAVDHQEPPKVSWLRRFLRRLWLGAPDVTPRRYLVVPSLLLLAGALIQRPGQIAPDTKVALVLNPARFLASALHFWNPLSDSGSVGDQSTGYLVPMGPFFLLTHALGISPAVAQRLWLALLLVVGLWGVVRLADALGIGNRTGRIVGAMGYVISPFVVARIGNNSSLLLGDIMLPWVLLPLVRATYTPRRETPAVIELPEAGAQQSVAARGKDRPPRRPLSARRAAALSGVAVLLTGGINASVTLDMLIVPVLWLALMCRGRGAWALRAWWLAAVVCATAWWAFPLALQGKYGINFVQYTESATTTTSVTSLPETIRGTADWLAYLHFGTAELPSAWTYVNQPAAVIASFVLAALGLAGLSRYRVPARRFLVTSLAIGVVAVAAAYAGSPHGVLSDWYRHALSGPLGAFRNINKFQPLVRLPLALGLAQCLPLIAVKATSRRRRRLRMTANGLTAAVLAGAVVIGAAPIGLSRVYQPGTFSAVPKYWVQASSWLNQAGDGTRTLLVPGSGFGSYTWGTPADEPMLWLSTQPWAVRNIIPLGGVNSTRWLDGIETQLEQRATPSLAATLTRAGIGYVLVRNDLAQNTDDPPPTTDQVHAALSFSGLHRVAAFGPLVKGRRSGIQIYLHSKANPGLYPALEIYTVPGASRVNSYPASSLAVLSGGPEALPGLSGNPILGNRPTVLAADLAATTSGYAKLSPDLAATAWIDTDTLPRRDEQFGSLHSGFSYLLAAGQNAAGEKAAPQVRLDVDPNGHQTTAVYSGIAGVSASHYGFILAPNAQSGPQAAVDSDPFSAWSLSGYPDHDVGQWLQLTLPAARTVPKLSLRLLDDSSKRSRITAIRVTTDSGSVVTPLLNTEDAQAVIVPAGPTKTIRLTIASVSPTSAKNSALGPGIREVIIPGVTIGESVALPNDAAPYFPAGGAATLSYVFNRDRSEPHDLLDLDVENQVSRVFTVPRKAVFHGYGTAVDRSFELTRPVKGSTITMACGTGPTVKIDDRSFATAVHGSRADWAAGQPITLQLCSNKPIVLAAGRHTFVTLAGTSTRYRPSLGLASFTLTTAQPKAATARAATITNWGDERRTVTMTAGPASILTIHENFNASWQAKANGKRLQAIRIDGWQQGFVVPAGAAVTVSIVNHPGIVYREWLLISAILVLLLLIAAFWPSRKPLRVREPREHRMLTIRLASLLVAAATTALVAGPLVAAVVPGLAVIVWGVRRVNPLLAFAGVAVAGGLAIAYPAHYPSSNQGSFAPIAQIAVALGIAVAVLSAGRRPRKPSSRGDGAEAEAEAGVTTEVAADAPTVVITSARETENC